MDKSTPVSGIRFSPCCAVPIVEEWVEAYKAEFDEQEKAVKRLRKHRVFMYFWTTILAAMFAGDHGFGLLFRAISIALMGIMIWDTVMDQRLILAKQRHNYDYIRLAVLLAHMEHGICEHHDKNHDGRGLLIRKAG